jgi:hypothetical protein
MAEMDERERHRGKTLLDGRVVPRRDELSRPIARGVAMLYGGVEMKKRG